MLRKIAFAMFGLAGLLFLVLVLAFIFEGGENQETARETSNETKEVATQEKEGFSPPESWHKLDKSKEMQELREDFIQSYKNKDIIDRVGDVFGFSLQVYVGSAWEKTKFDMKKTCISNVFDYYYAKNPKLMSITLKDPKTDREVGKYSYNEGYDALNLSY
jgi:hypothetical protein